MYARFSFGDGFRAARDWSWSMKALPTPPAPVVGNCQFVVFQALVFQLPIIPMKTCLGAAIVAVVLRNC